MIVNKYTIFVIHASIVIALINIERTGWLDRLVQYHKNKFYNELVSVVPLQIKASIEHAPAGYADSPLWDIHSVMHLLTLISKCDSCKPTRNALRRMLRPTRRIMMSKKQSYKMFPSLSKNINNILYYDVDTDVDYQDDIPEEYTGVPDDDAVIIVSNSVEARLPSAQISIKLLKEILEVRAFAGRIMPSTTKLPISWKPMNTSSSDNNATTVADKNGTASSVAGDGAQGANATDAGTKPSNVSIPPTTNPPAPA